MSHFFTVALVPSDTPVGKLSEVLNQKFAPFDENLEVLPYDHDCYCLGNVAKKAGREHADKTVATIETLRDGYWELPEPRPEWDDHIKEWRVASDSVEKVHPLFGKPDPECDECKGTGKYESTRNPQSKWDWWRVGGRWDGRIQAKPRESDNGFNWGDQHQLPDHNTILVKDMPGGFVSCFAVLTPEGEWIERGQMGWWGMVSGDTGDAVWQEQLKGIFARYSECLAVGCDLHI